MFRILVYPTWLLFSVLQKDLVEIRQASGIECLGVFALCPIPCGTLITCESGLAETCITQFPIPAKCFPSNVVKKLRGLASAGHVQDNLREIFVTNAFQCERADGIKYDIVFEVASRFNHSCLPNTNWWWNEANKLFSVAAQHDIPKGEELFVEYLKTAFLHPSATRRTLLSGSIFLPFDCCSCFHLYRNSTKMYSRVFEPICKGNSRHCFGLPHSAAVW